MDYLFRAWPPAGPEVLSLPGADIRFEPRFLDSPTADRVFRTLLNDTPWEARKVFVWGQWRLQPRLVAWYGDPEARYSYSGDTLEPIPWSATLAELRGRVEEGAAAAFNSVLLNLYRDQNDRMGWHNDAEPELGATPVIASLSLGETRRFMLKRRDKRHPGIVGVELPHGSLLIMAGDTQKNWVHAVNSEANPRGPRINLTFRLIRPRLNC